MHWFRFPRPRRRNHTARPRPPADEDGPQPARAPIQIAPALTIAAQFDHLVVLANSLDEGAQWCRATLGVIAQPGGAHALMGTHNLLVSLRGDAGPPAYLQILAVDPAADPAFPVWPRGQRPARRWFDVDEAALRERVRREGPQLVAWVARVPNLDLAALALARLEIDGGEILPMARATSTGLLAWRMAVRPDGRRLFGGALPTLIEWAAASSPDAAPPHGPSPAHEAHEAPAPLASHPAQTLPDAGLRLVDLSLSHPDPLALRAACSALGLADLSVTQGPPGLIARLRGPTGLVSLRLVHGG